MRTNLILVLFLSITYSSYSQNQTSQYLDINNIKANFGAFGEIFRGKQPWDPSFEYPKGSGKHCNSANHLWIGGINRTDSNLHFATAYFDSARTEFWPGPLDSSQNISMNSSNKWNNIWKINQNSIGVFRGLQNHTLANTPKEILYWPAKGNIYSKNLKGQALQIPNRDFAPFVDVNNDEVYNALQGDYPLMKGEQMLWWIMNDNLDLHKISKGTPLKVEIHATAYACNSPLLKNNIFLEYKIINRSSNIYDSLVVGLRSETDLGKAIFDDYIGFDSSRNMAISYNGDAYDEGSNGYAYKIPQVGTMLVSFPDEQTTTEVGAFTFFYNGNSGYCNPWNAGEFYNYMTGRWRDSSYFKKGCSPYNANTANSPFVFPGDPQLQNSISEVKCNNTPYDRRFVLSTKATSLKPNSFVTAKYAFLVVESNNPWDFSNLKHHADLFISNPNDCVQMGLSTKEINEISSLKIYPNPTSDYFIIEDEDFADKKISVYNSYGQLVLKRESKDLKTNINMENLASGLYFIKIQKKDQFYSQSILLK